MKRNELRAMLLEQPYDALVLTSEISRRYATGFHSTAGAVYLSAKQAVFFTDFRYVEAARAAIKDFEVREIKAGQSYSALINELLDEDGAKKVALEDKTLTYAEFMSWGTALHATARPVSRTAWSSCACARKRTRLRRSSRHSESRSRRSRRY